MLGHKNAYYENGQKQVSWQIDFVKDIFTDLEVKSQYKPAAIIRNPGVWLCMYIYCILNGVRNSSMYWSAEAPFTKTTF